MQQFKYHTERLRASGLRPTKQRLALCKILFNRKETFHFTIEKLKQIAARDIKRKISLATLYNTVYAFKKRGYLKEISLKGNQAFFDTNTKNHHHFYDEDTAELVDIKDENVVIGKIPKTPSGKKISGIEITFRIARDNHSQKKQINQ